MIVYINGVQKNVLILGNENEVLDETLDSASFSYIDSNPLPLAPYQRVEILHENTPSTYFVTISDSVEPYTPTSNLYKHEIACAESTRILSKRMLRNSVFSQPPMARIGRMSIGAKASVQIASHRQYTMEKIDVAPDYPTGGYAVHLTIPSGEKCSRCYIRITTQVFMGAINDTNWTNSTAKKFSDYGELRVSLSSLAYWNPNVGKLNLHYTNANNETKSEELNVDGEVLNGEIDCPRIKELLNAGATDIYLKTHNDFPLYFDARDGFPTDADIDGFSDHLIGFSVQFEIVAETYIHTAYSILQEIQSRLKQEHYIHTYDGNWYLQQNQVPFSLPQSGELYTLLNNTITPNMTFTQCSVYEAVAEVFRLFDAIFTMDEDGVLGITYFNEKTGDATTTIRNKAVAINSAIGEERYINGLMCYYQDARAEVAFPRGGTFAPLSTKQIGVASDPSDKVFRTPSPIHDVIGFYQKVNFQIYIASAICTINDYEIDMTNYLFERGVWSSTLDVSDGFPNVSAGTKQMNTITYTKGDSYVDVSGSYTDSWGHYKRNFINATKSALCLALGKVSINDVSNAPNVTPNNQYQAEFFDWVYPRLRIEYHTASNGVFKVESYSNKYDGEMPIDQASGAIDLGKAGLNLLGLSFKMGEPTLNVTHRATSWESRIQKGFVLTYQGEQWTANNCRYTCIDEDTYQGQISFVKNYNELSLNKKVLREKRLSSVSNELTIKSEEIITEYCYVYSEHDGAITSTNARSSWYFPTFFKALANSVNAKYSDIELKKLNDCSFAVNDGDGNKRIYIPTIVYGAGDVICFEMSFSDPMVAGIRFKGEITNGFWGARDYYSDYVRYTDKQARFSECVIRLEYDRNSDEYDLNFPILPWGLDHTAFVIGSLIENKQPNEVFALNYQMAFIPKDPKRVIIGKAFIENNFFTKGKIVSRPLYFYYSNDTYSVMDTKGRGSRVALNPSTNQIRMENEDYYCYLQFSPALGGATYNSWAVCDENGDILFACNSNQEAKLYFTLAPSRL